MCIVTVSCAYREGSVVGTRRVRIVYVSCMYRVRIVFKSYRLYRPTHRSRIVYVSFIYRLHILSSVSAQRIVYVSIMYRIRLVMQLRYGIVYVSRPYRSVSKFRYGIETVSRCCTYLFTYRNRIGPIRFRYEKDDTVPIRSDTVRYGSIRL